MINELETSSGYKINKALQLAPRKHSHHVRNVLATELSASHTLSPVIFLTTREWEEGLTISLSCRCGN